jgi:hypothetical protein
VIARALIAQCTIDDDKVRRAARRRYLACRCEAQQQSATTCKELFSNQDGEGRTHRASDDADCLSRQRDGIERRVVTGPAVKGTRLTRAPQIANDVAVRIKDADGRCLDAGQAFLPPRFAQQRRGPENG